MSDWKKFDESRPKTTQKCDFLFKPVEGEDDTVWILCGSTFRGATQYGEPLYWREEQEIPVMDTTDKSTAPFDYLWPHEDPHDLMELDAERLGLEYEQMVAIWQLGMTFALNDEFKYPADHGLKLEDFAKKHD